MNLPDSAPGFDPGELPRDEDEYAAMLAEVHRVGIRTVRIYTIEQPAFYDALLAFNRDHGDDPVYLVVGVTLAEVDRLLETEDLFGPTVTGDFSQEVRDAVAAVHGDLRRDPRPGRSSGTWRSDVSPWVVAYVPGIELDGRTVAATDRTRADEPAYDGTYFRSTPEASASERWHAARLDELAGASAAYGVSVPVAFMNWPTTDPLRHPSEPLPTEDVAGLDQNHVLPTEAWPGGTMAVYDAYPYYPDFLWSEPALQDFSYAGRPDPYAGYLAALQRHHAAMPLFLAEYGVPSSLGSAHLGPLGRDQGGHSEQEAMRIDAELLRMQHDLGLAGGLVFAWEDEWFKRTWNTVPRQVPGERRRLWHDPWTNEQWFGIYATDPAELGSQRLTRGDGPIGATTVTWDPAWVTMEVPLEDGLTEPVWIAVDVVPGGPASGRLPGSNGTDGTAPADTVSDYAVLVRPGGEAQAYARQELDAVTLDWGWAAGERPYVDGWVEQQLMLNRPRTNPLTGERLPAEVQDVGALREGPWDPEDADFDSRNTWRTDGDTLVVRFPWAALGISDPSSRQALVVEAQGPGKPAVAASRTVERMGVAVVVGSTRADTDGFAWDGWESVDRDRWTLRQKAGAAVFLELAEELGTAVS